MSPKEASEQFVQELFDAQEDCGYTYDDLARVAGQWVKWAEREASDAHAKDGKGSSEPVRRLARFFARQHFAEFRARLKPRSSLEVALLELFLLSRIRMYVLAYLSVQEGEDFEGAQTYETRVPMFISQMLQRLGRQSYCTLNPGVGRVRLRIDIDPLIHLRKMYGILVRSRRCGRGLSLFARVGMAYHRLGFSIKSWLVAMAARTTLRSLVGRDLPRNLTVLFRSGLVRRLIAVTILILFPSASELTEPEWLGLLAKIEAYFVPRIVDLFEAMPEQSARDHGFIKLCKVAFGTIAGRTSVRERHEKDNVEFIYNTLRLAYSWGVTYPLVDNVLDSAKTSPEVRAKLTRVLSQLFAGEELDQEENSPDCDNISVREVKRRLSEVLSLIPPDRLSRARTTLGHLLESHWRDSKRHLATITIEGQDDTWTEVMIDTALKSMLVRLATMEVCGIEVDRDTLARGLVRSLFNQLGDDLWDIYEDAEDDRVTPYTFYLSRGGVPNPFLFYLNYSALLTKDLSRRRQTAVFMGFCETLRDSLLAMKSRNGDPLGVSNAIAAMIKRSAQVSVGDLIANVPHVDFDAVLFAFETALFEIVSP